MRSRSWKGTDCTCPRPGPGHPRTQLGTFLLVMALGVSTIQAEVYTSTAQLEHVLRVEREVVAILEDYLQKAETKLQKIRNYVEDYERIVADDVTQTVNNPLNAYHLMKRLAIDWNYIENEMQQSEWFNVLTDIRERRSVLHMPQEMDLQGAAMALIRLKQTYHLNVTELARGNLQGIMSQVQLTARDCLFLGRNTMNIGSTEQAVEWLEQAMVLASQEGNQTAGQDEIRPYLLEAISMFDKLNSNKNYFGPAYSPKTDNIYDLGEQFQVSPQGPEVPPITVDNPYNDARNYDALCRGQRLRAPEYEAKLKCYFKTGPHPYLRLRPVKVEENHLDPPLLSFHDIIYDTEIELIQMLARPMLERSTVVGTNGEWRQVSDTRTSKNTWIYDSTVQEQPALQRLQQRIECASGLNAGDEQQAEALQVANYGVGGHYVPHYDFLFQDKSQMAGVDPNDYSLGDRTATLMFYLSDVSRGGATVFPKMGAGIWPRKGSAAFWFNLLSDGTGDQRTLHGACPVLLGSKWVANKWIRERAQMRTRPCELL